MDLLFKRYASPFLFVDGMIQSNMFSEFVSKFVHKINAENEERTNWEFFLHKINDMSFGEFVEQMKTDKENQNMTSEDIESTILQSFDILNNFTPEKVGEE